MFAFLDSRTIAVCRLIPRRVQRKFPLEIGGAVVAIAPRFNAGRLRGALAQLVEHHNGIVGVSGSNPLRSTTFSQGWTRSYLARGDDV
jgi:hypothetical protein